MTHPEWDLPDDQFDISDWFPIIGPVEDNPVKRALALLLEIRRRLEELFKED